MPASSLPPSASPTSSEGAASRTTASSQQSAYAFLVHSPNTVANHLPPDVDNRPLARQKRRRTSKEDEEILKAEYLKNPKPDKAARIDIVAKVALGEKEVQIWFQNKRQNDRRRSRPLDSSSSPAHLMSESSAMSDPATDDACDGPDAVERTDESPAPEEPAHPTAEAAEGASALEKEENEEKEVLDAAASVHVQPQSVGNPVPPPTADSAPLTDTPAPEPAPVAETTAVEASSSQQTFTSSQGASQSRNSWISNRRSASFRYTEEYAHDTVAPPNPPVPSAEPSLKRAHSFVRLSMADDGTARVITDADKTPSPPHAKPNPSVFSRAAAGLRRSYSAAGLNERLAAVSRGEPSPKIARTASTIGRSRDSRAWEFWCDPDTRNSRSLMTRADQEGSGSAADAIGLLRANRRVLSQNQLRQNAPLLPEAGSKKSRPSMQRASTSLGRLQTKSSKKGDEFEELPQTESDKENWEPEMPKSNRPRATPTNSQRPRQALRENTEIMSQSTSLGAMLAKEKRKAGKTGSESSDPEQNDELRHFMSGGKLGSATTLSSAEEAGCVEGLLKLSQGNWR